MTIAISWTAFSYWQNQQKVTHAQDIAFLSPPYFGTTKVWNIFDHEYPNYNQTPPGEMGNMVHNDNQRLDDPFQPGGDG
ncbi:MAG: hypothetical protein HC804_14885, partial [Anaerolineae bacterium]|nr:hypothetical protein [Anaerolineae bacterium]